MRTSARKQKSSSKCQQGPPPSHTKQKGLSRTQWFFFLYLTQTAKHRANFHRLARLGWALSPPEEGNVYWGTDLNGVSKWCLSERDLGTAGEQFSDLSGSVSESQGCSFPHKLFQGHGLKPGVSVTWLRGTFLAFLFPPAGWVCGEHQGTFSKHPPGMGLSSNIACKSLLRLPVLCQGMLKIWALSSRLQAPQDLPGEGLLSPSFLPPLLHRVWAVSVWTRWWRRPLEVWGLLDQWCYLLLPERWWHLTPVGCDSPKHVCHPPEASGHCWREGTSVIHF